MTARIAPRPLPPPARPLRRAATLLLAATMALAGCASQRTAGPSFDASAPGLTADQRTVREVAQKVTPPEEQGGNNWFGDNAIVLLAAAGCVAGAVVGGSARGCLTGAVIGGLAGAVARITVFDKRDSYANDKDFVNAVSDEMDRVLAENEQLVPAAERLADAHELTLSQLKEAYGRGSIGKAEYRKQVEPLLVDEQALAYIAESNKQLASDLDKALTGVNVATSQQQRLEDQEGDFLADSGRIQYAQERLSGALAQVPKEVLK